MADTDDEPVKKRKIRKADATLNLQEALTKKLRDGVSSYVLNKGLYNQNHAAAQLAQVEVIEAMRGLGKERSETLDIDDLTYKVTIITPEKAELDEAALRQKVGEEVWSKITKQVLDRHLLDDAVKTGLIELETLSSCVSTRPTNPYIKVERTRK